jgi:hypothetical protein
MFDFLGFFETHKIADVILVSLAILVGTLLYREISRWISDSNEKHRAVAESSSIIKRVETLMGQYIERAKELCDGKNCSNFEKVVAEFSVLKDVIIKFEHDSRESRALTAESIQRIERNIDSFTNDLGREVIRFLREGKRDRNGS